MSRRDEALTAAVQVLGEQGLYGLTHRKVDRAGGLPDGTTSNHFRTRSALLKGVVDHLVTLESAIWDGGGFDEIDSVDGLIEASAAFVNWAVTDGRPRSVALIALLEAAITDPDVAAVLAAARAHVEERSAAVCTAVGMDESVSEVLMDVTDALIFRSLSIAPGAIDARTYFRQLISKLASS